MTDSLANTTCSFRNYLKHELSPFLQGFRESGLTPVLLADFVLLQATFQEEGAPVFPTVFITDTLESLMKGVDARDLLPIGRGPYTSETVQKVFKECAVLASVKSWVVYVETTAQGFNYGVFRTDQYPLSPTSFERLRLIDDRGLNVIGLNRLGRNFVEIRGAHGNSKYVNTGSEQDQSLVPKDVIERFAKAACADADLDVRDSVEAFYYRTGFDILHARTGTLIAIVAAGSELPDLFEGGVRLATPLSISSNIHELFFGKDATEGFQQLEGSATLLQNMASLDGVTIVDSSGSVLGYRFFVRSKSIGAERSKQLSGGARRWAFETLCSHLNENLRAVLYKSSDGALGFMAARDR